MALVKHLVETVYATAIILRLVLDNLNTHFRQTFVDVLGGTAAAVRLQRVQFHYTPKHASWLNMTEIEIGIMWDHGSAILWTTHRHRGATRG